MYSTIDIRECTHDYLAYNTNWYSVLVCIDTQKAKKLYAYVMYYRPKTRNYSCMMSS